MSPSVTKRFNVRVFGKGDSPVMFAHGFGCDQSVWRYIAPDFEKEHKGVVFDLAGHGKSDRGAYDKNKYSTLSGYADDMIKIIEDLGLKNVAVIGHSVSNMIAVLAANKRPELFRCLVMIGASPRYLNDNGYKGGFEKKDLDGMLENMKRDYRDWVHFLSVATMKNPAHPELSEELERLFMANDPEVIRQFAEVTFFSDNRDDIKKLEAPSLVLQTPDDIIAPKQVGDYLAKNMPHTTLEMLDASGHCPHMSAPRQTSGAIRHFLDNLGA